MAFHPLDILHSVNYKPTEQHTESQCQPDMQRERHFAAQFAFVHCAVRRSCRCYMYTYKHRAASKGSRGSDALSRSETCGESSRAATVSAGIAGNGSRAGNNSRCVSTSGAGVSAGALAHATTARAVAAAVYAIARIGYAGNGGRAGSTRRCNTPTYMVCS